MYIQLFRFTHANTQLLFFTLKFPTCLCLELMRFAGFCYFLKCHIHFSLGFLLLVLRYKKIESDLKTEVGSKRALSIIGIVMSVVCIHPVVVYIFLRQTAPFSGFCVQPMHLLFDSGSSTFPPTFTSTTCLTTYQFSIFNLIILPLPT